MGCLVNTKIATACNHLVKDRIKMQIHRNTLVLLNLFFCLVAWLGVFPYFVSVLPASSPVIPQRMDMAVFKSWNFLAKAEVSISHLPFFSPVLCVSVAQAVPGVALGRCRQRGWKMTPYLCTVENWPHPEAHRDLELPCIKKKLRKKQSLAVLYLCLFSSSLFYSSFLKI